MRTYELETTVSLPDEDEVDVTVEYTVDYWGDGGVPPSLNHPGESPTPPEFTIVKVCRDKNGEDITAQVKESDLYDVIYQDIDDMCEGSGYGYDYY